VPEPVHVKAGCGDADDQCMTYRSGTVVLLLDQIDAYQAQIVAGLRRELESAGIPLLVHVSGVQQEDGSLPESLTRLLAAPRPALGVVVTPSRSAGTDAAVRALLQRGDLPTLYLNQAAVDGRSSSLRVDNALGMRAIARHLVTECGARRVLAVRGHRHRGDSQERESALRSELAALGLTLDDELLVDGEDSRRATFRAVGEAVARDPAIDAVVAFDDRSALGAVDALRAIGLSVPEHVMVTGFADDDFAAIARPSLTTISQNLVEQGALAARLLLDLADGRPPTTVQLPVELRRRRSTRPLPGADVPAHEGQDDGGLAAAAAADQLWARTNAIDTALEINRSFVTSRSVEDVIDRLSVNLPRLEIARAFLVLRTEEAGAASGFVAMAYHDEIFDDVTAEQPFDLAAILPGHLRHHLEAGTLVLQPLGVGEIEMGYLLVDQNLRSHSFLSDALGMDLTRAIDAIRRTSRLAQQAGVLEALVTERTRQLESEIGTRRRAENELRRLNSELRASLHLDGLTGIANRSAFEAALAAQWAGHARSGQPLSLLMVDVDHFKAFNDRYGHLHGDEALRVVASCLSDAVRRVGDVAARYGGEEFALVLPNTPDVGAVVVAERVRQLLERASLTHADSPVDGRLTVSIGAATAYPDMTTRPEDLIAAADRALYDVKNSGRDAVALSRGPAAQDESPAPGPAAGPAAGPAPARTG
jgi:diguanylate cyclase (GGDEF)-like protein